MAVSLDSFRVRDVTEWTPAEVHEFLESVLPGHPCLDYFTYTSGYVLCTLDREDLRRQAKSEEAANVIFAELKKCRRAAGVKSGVHASQDRGGLEGPPTFTVYVKVRQEVAFELDLLPSDSVASLKAAVEEREGTPADCQRLICNGMSMQDDRSLASYDVRHGATVLLVPQLRESTRASKSATFSAPRGMLMVPGSKAWQPAGPHRPYVPVIGTNVARSFPVSLEFASEEDSRAFAAAAQEEPPVLEIQPAGKATKSSEVRVHLDPDTGGVRLAETMARLEPNLTYEAVIHFGGRGGDVKAALVTGAEAA